MPKRPEVFLLDAGPVIKLFELEIWREVFDRAAIIVPSIVACEAHFAIVDGERRAIELTRLASDGVITVKDCSPGDVDATLSRFDASIRDSIHPGEAQALALLASWRGERPLFCLADQLATIALCLIGLSECAVSLERLLGMIGLARPIRPSWFSEERMREWLTEGRRRALVGEGTFHLRRDRG